MFLRRITINQPVALKYNIRCWGKDGDWFSTRSISSTTLPTQITNVDIARFVNHQRMSTCMSILLKSCRRKWIYKIKLQCLKTTNMYHETICNVMQNSLCVIKNNIENESL